MTDLEGFLRTNGETLAYAGFFGAIAALAALESVAGMRREGARRSRRWPTNWALTALNVVVIGALPLSGLLVADWAAERGLGLFNLVEAPAVVSVAVSMLAFSFRSFALHFAMHHVPALWRIHRVHHTDTHMDVSTTVRFHPVELALQAPVAAATVPALGAPPAAVILYELLDAVLNVFSHANIRLPARLDAALSRLVVTPHLHRVHHSTAEPETNSNFGATLPLWDMLFGTYRRKTPEALARQPIGLDEMQDARAWSLAWALTLPFRRLKRLEAAPADDGA